MAEDEKGVVQGDAVSPEGETVPEDTGTLPVEVEAPKPLTEEERIRQVAAEVTEAAKREIQSVKDKARSEVEQALGRAGLAEETSAGMETRFRELDPEAAESAKTKAELAFYRKQVAVQQRQQAVIAFNQKFLDNINQFIVESGVDVNDKGIDWGNDAKDYFEKQRRILTSVGKIQRENLTATEAKASQKVADAEALTRQEVDSVDTSIPAGAGRSPKRQDIIKRYSEGDPNISTAEYQKAMEQK